MSGPGDRTTAGGLALLDVEPTSRAARYGVYVREILEHAGLPYRTVTPEELASGPADVSVLLIGSHTESSEDVARTLERFARTGGAIVALGGTSGLDDLFGCRDEGPQDEWWLTAAGEHPVTNGVTRPLHAFGGRGLEVTADDVEVLAHGLEGDRYHDREGWRTDAARPALTSRRLGDGLVTLIAADVARTVVRIQQGVPVHVDGLPAPDGTAAVDDGILKADDGIALDYRRDRASAAGVHWFTEPIADAWRDLIIRSVLWSARATGTTIPMLWYWPDAVPAVGQISHDTDHNIPEKAEILFDLLAQAGIPSTWCLQYPGGYAPAFYPRLLEAGHEVALHYDAHTKSGRTFWREDDFLHQLEWLRAMAGIPVTSNKNHYLRWEGATEFFLWLERAGIRSDQSKGPSKKGNKGFLFGSCHPWFPLEEQTGRRIDVLEVPLHAQDLTDFCPYEVGPAVVDQALAHHGVAHLLFHPGRTAKPAVAQALLDVVAYGKERGMAWWTNERIQDWERARRRVRLELRDGPQGPVWAATSPDDVARATVLMFDGEDHDTTAHGFPARRVVLDLEAGRPTTLEAPVEAAS